MPSPRWGSGRAATWLCQQTGAFGPRSLLPFETIRSGLKTDSIAACAFMDRPFGQHSFSIAFLELYNPTACFHPLPANRQFSRRQNASLGLRCVLAAWCLTFASHIRLFGTIPSAVRPRRAGMERICSKPGHAVVAPTFCICACTFLTERNTRICTRSAPFPLNPKGCASLWLLSRALIQI